MARPLETKDQPSQCLHRRPWGEPPVHLDSKVLPLEVAGLLVLRYLVACAEVVVLAFAGERLVGPSQQIVEDNACLGIGGSSSASFL